MTVGAGGDLDVQIALPLLVGPPKTGRLIYVGCYREGDGVDSITLTGTGVTGDINKLLALVKAMFYVGANGDKFNVPDVDDEDLNFQGVFTFNFINSGAAGQNISLSLIFKEVIPKHLRVNGE